MAINGVGGFQGEQGAAALLRGASGTAVTVRFARRTPLVPGVAARPEAPTRVIPPPPALPPLPLLPRLTSCDRHGVLFRRTPRLRPAPDLASAPASVPTPQHETAATGSHPRVTSQPPPPATGRLPPGRTASSVDRGSQSECHTSCHGSNAWARSVRPCDSALLFNINQNRT